MNEQLPEDMYADEPDDMDADDYYHEEHIRELDGHLKWDNRSTHNYNYYNSYN